MIKFYGKCLFVNSGGRKILVVGDLHFGYEEALNRAGIFVSREAFDESIKYLERVFERVGKVDEVVLLGDVKHFFGEVAGQEWKEILNFIKYLKDKSSRVVIIKGNHDKILEPVAKRAEVEIKDYYTVGEFCFLHGDRDFLENYNPEIRYWVVGHAHPAVKISDGIKVEKYKCFFVGEFKRKRVIIVPSFFDYNIGSDPRENHVDLAWRFRLKDFKVFIVQDDGLDVLKFGRLRDI